MPNINKILKENLIGEILDIQDPRQYDEMTILRSYFREILLLARKYARPCVDYEDLVTEGLIGLLDAIERWDPEKSTGPQSFRQLAIVRIKSSMFEFFLANNTPYKIPNYMGRAIALVEQLQKLIESQEYDGDHSKVLLEFSSEDFYNKVPRRLGERVAEIKERIVKLASNSNRNYEEMVALVVEVKNDIQNYEEQVEFEVSPEEIASQRDFLEKFLQGLKTDARDVIEMRIRDGYTLEQIGKEKGFSRERARQIIDDTIGYFKQTRMFTEAEDT